MMELPRKICPNDGAVMVVTWNEPMGIAFTCPVCGVDGTNDELGKAV